MSRAGAPCSEINALMSRLVSSTTRTWRCAPSAVRAETFRADLGQSFLDGFLDLLGRHVSITSAGFLHGLLKDAPASGLLDEFGEIALLHPLLCQKATHGHIGRLRDLDAPAHGVLFHGVFSKAVMCLSAYTRIFRCLQ